MFLILSSLYLLVSGIIEGIRCWLCISVAETLKANVLVQITPVDTIEAELIVVAFFIRGIVEFGVPKERLLISFPLESSPYM